MDTKADTNADAKIEADAEAIGFQAPARKSRCAAWAARAQAKKDAAAEFEGLGCYPKGQDQCKCSFKWQAALALALLALLSLHACLPEVQTRRPGVHLVVTTAETLAFYSTPPCYAILPFNATLPISNSTMLQPSYLHATNLSGNCLPFSYLCASPVQLLLLLPPAALALSLTMLSDSPLCSRFTLLFALCRSP